MAAPRTTQRNIGREILDGIEEVKAWRRGEVTLRSTEITLPVAADVAGTRKQLSLSQDAFAAFLGVSVGMVRGVAAPRLETAMKKMSKEEQDRWVAEHADQFEEDFFGNKIVQIRHFTAFFTALFSPRAPLDDVNIDTIAYQSCGYADTLKS